MEAREIVKNYPLGSKVVCLTSPGMGHYTVGNVYEVVMFTAGSKGLTANPGWGIQRGSISTFALISTGEGEPFNVEELL